MSNGAKFPQDGDKSLGDTVADVSEKASQLVREEIELAKAEVKDKVSKLTKGAVIAAAAGVFAVFGITMLFHALAWLLADVFDNAEVGFGIVALLLFVLAAISGLVAARLFKKGAPPTPDMAIDQAKRTKADLDAQKIQRDQVGRGLERGEEAKV
jgi:uncharacterized membrane protein YqjE